MTWLIGKPAVTRARSAPRTVAVGRPLLEHGVGGERVDARGERPDVQVVDGLHSGHAFHRLAQRREVHLARRPLEQHVHGLAQERPRAGQDEERDRDRDERVHPEPAGGGDHRRARDHADGGQRVGQDLVVGAPHVEARLASRRGGGRRPPG